VENVVHVSEVATLVTHLSPEFTDSALVQVIGSIKNGAPSLILVLQLVELGPKRFREPNPATNHVENHVHV
jgi:hypothetical protein